MGIGFYSFILGLSAQWFKILSVHDTMNFFKATCSEIQSLTSGTSANTCRGSLKWYLKKYYHAKLISMFGTASFRFGSLRKFEGYVPSGTRHNLDQD